MWSPAPTAPASPTSIAHSDCWPIAPRVESSPPWPARAAWSRSCGPGRSTYPDRFLSDLVDYRLRYASYRLDTDLQAAHARFPFVITWDDHEVANNYAGDTVPADLDEEDLVVVQASAPA